MRLLVRLLALPVVVAALALLAFVATGAASLSGLGYASSLVLVTVSAMFESARVRRRLVLSGLALLVATAGFRVAFAEHGRHLRMRTPSEARARWVNRLLDEADLAVNASRALAWVRLVPDPDVPELAEVMRDAYARMRAAEGWTPSPVVATYAGLEGPWHDDTLEIGDVEGGAGVVVFLHGYAGSFTLPCWVVSLAASDAGFATVCPATRWVGDWWSAAGEATVRETVGRLRARGVRRIVLAGLSNGGVGASLLASRMRGTFDGLVVISGASPEAASPHVAVLALQGTHDAQMPAAVVRAYAARVGGRYLPLDAGHFALLVREAEARGAITSFLRARAQTDLGPAPARLQGAPP
jgi:hypothetical protein